jgi:hypothetical protein
MKTHNSRIGHWLNKHERWLTFVGAFIVFTTFIIREELGERLKEQAGSIAIAQQLYDEHVEHKELRIAINALHKRNTPAHKAKENEDEQVRDAVTVADSAIDDTADVLRLLQPLVSKLDQRTNTRLTHFESEAAQERTARGLYQEDFDSVITGQHTYTAPSWRYRPDDLQPSKRPNWAFFRLGRSVDFEFSVYYLEGDVESFAKDVLREAKEKEEQSEKRLQSTKLMLVALFALGWGLSLLGKLYGISGAASDE